MRKCMGFCFLAGLILSFFSCSSGFEGEILTGERDIRVDVENLLFKPYGNPAEQPWEWGLDVLSAEITVSTDTGDFSVPCLPGDLDPAFGYTDFSVPVAGKLLSVSAQLTVSSPGNGFTVVLDSVSDGSYWTGWEVFANVTKFRLSAQVDPDSFGNSSAGLDVCPRGGFGLGILADSGLTASYMAFTDRGTTLVSGKIALQPQFMENPSDLEYRIYYSVVDENLKSLYSPAENSDADYLDPDHTWKEVWTVKEMTDTGRIMGESTLIKLTAYNSGGPAINAANPMGDGFASFVIDLTAQPELTGKYFLAGLVVSREGLKVPSRMIIVEIR